MMSLSKLQKIAKDIDMDISKRLVLGVNQTKSEVYEKDGLILQYLENGNWNLLECPYQLIDEELTVVMPSVCKAFLPFNRFSSTIRGYTGARKLVIYSDRSSSLILGGLLSHALIREVDFRNIKSNCLGLSSTFSDSDLENVYFKDNTILNTLSGVFENCNRLVKLDLSNVMLKGAMNRVFNSCKNLEDLLIGKSMVCLNTRSFVDLPKLKHFKYTSVGAEEDVTPIDYIYLDTKSKMVLAETNIQIGTPKSTVIKDIIELWYDGEQVGTRIVFLRDKDYTSSEGNVVKEKESYDIDMCYKGTKKEDLKCITTTRLGVDCSYLISRLEYGKKIRFKSIVKKEFLKYYKSVEKYI